MAESGWVRNCLAIGHFEFRRSVVDLRGSPGRILGLVAGAALPAVVVAVVGYYATPKLATEFLGDSIPPAVLGAVTGFWVFVAFMIAQRTGSARPRPPESDLLLTTVSARTAALGLYVAEVLRVLAYAALWTVSLTWLGFRVTGSPLVVATVPLAVVAVCSSAVAVGSLAGYLVVSLVSRSGTLMRYRNALSALSGILFFAFYAAFTVVDFDGGLTGLLGSIPVGWVVDLAALPAAFAAVDRALVGLGTNALVVGVGLAATVGVTGRYWYRTPARPEDDVASEPTSSGADASDRDWLETSLDDAVRAVRIPAIWGRDVQRVAEMAVVRSLRNPRRLFAFATPLFVVAYWAIGGSLDVETVRTYLPVGAAVVVPWVGGTVFSLNPLGDEGAVLPVTLTATDGETYVRGVVLAGLSVGVPLAAVATALSVVVSGRIGLATGLLVPLAAYLAGVAAFLGPAIGFLMPRFSGVSIGQSEEVLPPRTGAVLLSVLLVSGPGLVLGLFLVAPAAARAVVAAVLAYLPALVAALLAQVLPVGAVADAFASFGEGIRATDLETLRIVVGVPLLVGGILVAYLAYRVAVRRYERFVLT
jgi:ABC-2 type transport system permease protein